MSFKGPEGMVLIFLIIKAHVYIKILNNFPVPSIENCFGGDEILFQYDNASCCKAKEIKAFHQEEHIKSMTWPTNGLDLNENV